MKHKSVGFTILAASLLTVLNQNCSKTAFDLDQARLAELGICNGVSCSLDPLTAKPAVTTILLALGDEVDSQLVVNGGSSQLIAETVVRYSSPKPNPRILLVRDQGAGTESAEDTTYIATLLARYDVTFLQEPKSGLKDADLKNYDLIWFNNPGAPMGLSTTRDVLARFAGAVVLQGDDLSWGKDFSLQSLTGLKFVDNGESVRCDDGKSYAHDNNGGYQYRVTLNNQVMPSPDASALQFRYGNDIDNTTVARGGLEILALAQGGPSVCTGVRPAIVRYVK